MPRSAGAHHGQQERRAERSALAVRHQRSALGTPASTTRGFKEAEVTDVANWIADILDDNCSEAAITRTRAKVEEICRKFPVYAPVR